jgi:3-phenylpropionate/cinnamic acid dioxygenase small subunit
MEANQHDTSLYSYYVDEGYYAMLLDDLRDWEQEGRPADAAASAEGEALVIREARLLDEGKFEEWLDMLSKDCLYWAPASPGGGIPNREVTIAFDDRRRLEDRVARLRTGYAYSQIPASRTRRMLTNFEALQGSGDIALRVRSNFVIWEFRKGVQRALAGWYGHSLRKEDGRWKIVRKQINLIDPEQGHENLTLML